MPVSWVLVRTVLVRVSICMLEIQERGLVFNNYRRDYAIRVDSIMTISALEIIHQRCNGIKMIDGGYLHVVVGCTGTIICRAAIREEQSGSIC